MTGRIGRALSRRGVLLGAGAVAAAGLGSPLLLDAGQPTGRLLRSQLPLPEPYQVPLPVPPVLRPTRRTADADHYEITQRVASAEILPGHRTTVWGYDGMFPGPTLESRRARRTVVRHRNRLPVPTVVHLHGGRTPEESDGYPTDLILPEGVDWHGGHAMHDPRAVVTRGVREYSFPLDQPAATLWYHDHRMDFTGPAVYRGLAGFHLIRDDEEDALGLPAGDRELPLLIADRAFDEDGEFRYPAIDRRLRDVHGVTEPYTAGVFGDVILVNGAPWPVHEVSATRYRLRLLNGSNARRYRLALDPPPSEGPTFVQVGADAGLLDRARNHQRLTIAPAERFDVIVDFGRYPVGSTVTLVNELGSGSTARVMRFRVGRKGVEHSAPPDRLVETEPLPRSAATVTRDFTFRSGHLDDRRGWVIGGQPFSATRVDARPRLGTVEIWRFVADLHHPIHLHLTHFRVLSRNGRRPRRLDAGPKDTVDLSPGEAVEVIARFDGYRGRYVFHCHNLEHEDMGMMANFETV